MNWFSTYLTSSIGRKLTMSLTGLFLILFLIVHLLGNLQILRSDHGQAFNQYSYFMTHNPLIEIIAYGLYFFILLHAVQGLLLWASNRKAKGTTYAVRHRDKGVTWAAQNMALLGSLIFVFLVIHMGDFWYKVKFTQDLKLIHAYKGYEDSDVKDLYFSVFSAFQDPLYVALYVFSMVVLAFHLSHGFQSAFQTLGARHPKYLGLLQKAGLAYSILIPLGFAIIPLIIYFSK